MLQLGTSPLHLAAQYGHYSTTEVLLRAGVSRDARTKVDRTPLHMAASEGHASIVEVLLKVRRKWSFACAHAPTHTGFSMAQNLNYILLASWYGYNCSCSMTCRGHLQNSAWVALLGQQHPLPWYLRARSWDQDAVLVVSQRRTFVLLESWGRQGFGGKHTYHFYKHIHAKPLALAGNECTWAQKSPPTHK